MGCCCAVEEEEGGWGGGGGLLATAARVDFTDAISLNISARPFCIALRVAISSGGIESAAADDEDEDEEEEDDEDGGSCTSGTGWARGGVAETCDAATADAELPVASPSA